VSIGVKSVSDWCPNRTTSNNLTKHNVSWKVSNRTTVTDKIGQSLLNWFG